MSRSLLPFVLVALAIGVMLFVLTRPPQQLSGEMKARLAKYDGEAMITFANLPLPPDTKPYAPRTQERIELRRHWAINVTQDYERPGVFADTEKFYERELTAHGWVLFDRSTVDTNYCKAPYTLTVEKDTWDERTHRYKVRLTYDDSKGGKWTCAAATGGARPKN